MRLRVSIAERNGDTMTDAQKLAAWQLEYDDTPVDEAWLLSLGATAGSPGYYSFHLRNRDGYRGLDLYWEPWSKGRVMAWAAYLGENTERLSKRITTRGQVCTLARLMGAELREGAV